MQAQKLTQRSMASARRVTRTLRLVRKPTVAEDKAILVCDSFQQSERWRVALGLAANETTVLAEAAEVKACGGAQLALIDVAVNKIASILKALRANSALQQLLVLVVGDPIAEARELAGLLPQYRALACGKDEIIQLARRRLSGATVQPARHQIL